MRFQGRKSFTLLFLFLIINLIFNHVAFSQAIFQSYYDESTNTSFGKCISQLATGDFVIAGFTGTGSPDYNGMHLVKFSSTGSYLWGKIYGSNKFETAESMAPTTDGGFVIAGFGDANASGTDQDIYIIKTDASGNISWQKKISYNVNYDYVHSIIQSSDGGYVTCGYATITSSWTPPVVNVIKLSSTGSTTGAGTWNVNFSNVNGGEAFDVIESSDGNYVLTGSYFTANGNSDVFLLKLDSGNGSIIWSQTYGGNTSDNGYNVKQTIDGGFIITGRTLSYGAGDFDCFLLKTDASGNQQWFKTYGNPYTDEGHSVVETADGGFAVAGTLSHSWSDRDFYLFKTNILGNLLWDKSYGGNDWEECYGMTICIDGGFALTGRTFTFMSGFGYNAYVVKTDAFGNADCHEKPVTTIVNSISLGAPGTMTLTGGSLSSVNSTLSETAFSNSGIICSSTPLPIELSSFSGRNNNYNNILQWATASEINNNYFSVMRSRNKADFESIGTIKGAGNSSQHTNYTFTDITPFAGVNYYQLKQTDFNGEYEFSKIIAVKNSGNPDKNLIVYPNPTSAFIEINLHSGEEIFEIEIENALGQSILVQNIEQSLTTPSSNKINVSNLYKGIYFLKATTNRNYYSEKFIKE